MMPDLHKLGAIVLGLSALALTGCSRSEHLNNGNLTGHWSGERYEDGALVRWYVHNGADGRLQIEFSTCFAGQRVAQTSHFGKAALEDGRYRTIILTIVVDGEEYELAEADALVYDYDVLEMTDERMVYRYVGRPPTVYTVRRVDEFHELTCPPATHTVDTSARGRRGEDGWIRRGSVEDPDGQSDDTAEEATEASPQDQADTSSDAH